MSQISNESFGSDGRSENTINYTVKKITVDIYGNLQAAWGASTELQNLQQTTVKHNYSKVL